MTLAANERPFAIPREWWQAARRASSGEPTDPGLDLITGRYKVLPELIGNNVSLGLWRSAEVSKVVSNYAFLF